MQGPGYDFESLTQHMPPLWILVNGLGVLIIATYIAVCVLSEGFPCIYVTNAAMRRLTSLSKPLHLLRDPLADRKSNTLPSYLMASPVRRKSLHAGWTSGPQKRRL